MSLHQIVLYINNSVGCHSLHGFMADQMWHETNGRREASMLLNIYKKLIYLYLLFLYICVYKFANCRNNDHSPLQKKIKINKKTEKLKYQWKILVEINNNLDWQ